MQRVQSLLTTTKSTIKAFLRQAKDDFWMVGYRFIESFVFVDSIEIGHCSLPIVKDGAADSLPCACCLTAKR